MKFSKKAKQLTGFSLVECIMALLVFSMMMVMLFAIMAQILREKQDAGDYSSYVDLKISAGTPGTSDGTSDGREFQLLFKKSDDGGALLSKGEQLGILVKYTTVSEGSSAVVQGEFSDGAEGLARIDRVNRYYISSDGKFTYSP
jgi:hypothetical protein